MKNETRYAIMHDTLDCDYGIALKAKTDLGAIREARKIAKTEGLRGYQIVFFRKSDGCRGAIDP
jgi:hypothetical protein